MPSNHLILCRPLLLLPSIFPSIRVFSSESVLRIGWPKYHLYCWWNYAGGHGLEMVKRLAWHSFQLSFHSWMSGLLGNRAGLAGQHSRGLQTSNTHMVRRGGAESCQLSSFPVLSTHTGKARAEKPAVLPDGDLFHVKEQIQWKRASPPSWTLTVLQGLCSTCHLHDLNYPMK